MSDLFEKLNWKILVLILFGVFGLIILMGNMANRSFETTATKELSTPSPTKSETRTNSPSFPDTSFTTWKLYKTDRYEFTYPSGWKIEKRRIVNGGEKIIIKEKIDSSFPAIEISSEPSSSSATLAQKRKILNSLGFDGKKAIFAGLEAWEFRKVKNYYERRIFLTKSNYNFNLESKYLDNSQELILDRIISSFKFNQ